MDTTLITLTIIYCLILFATTANWAETDAIQNYQPKKWRKFVGYTLIGLGVLSFVITCIFLVVNLSSQSLYNHNQIVISFFQSIRGVAIFIAWGVYAVNFKSSDIKTWQKVTKVIGYILLHAILLYIFFGFFNYTWYGVEELLWDIAMVFVLFIFSIVLIRLARKESIIKDIIEEHKQTIRERKERIEEKRRTKIETKEHETMTTTEPQTKEIKHRQPLTFERKINIILLTMSAILCIASIVLFISACDDDFDYFGEGYGLAWLLTSFASSLFIVFWTILNYKRLTIEQHKKYGIRFLIIGFILCISPFLAFACLTISFLNIKRVFDNQQTE